MFRSCVLRNSIKAPTLVQWRYVGMHQPSILKGIFFLQESLHPRWASDFTWMPLIPSSIAHTSIGMIVVGLDSWRVCKLIHRGWRGSNKNNSPTRVEGGFIRAKTPPHQFGAYDEAIYSAAISHPILTLPIHRFTRVFQHESTSATLCCENNPKHNPQQNPTSPRPHPTYALTWTTLCYYIWSQIT